MRNRMGMILLVGALVLMSVAGVGGYLLGRAGLADASILVSIQNRLGTNLTSVQVLVNGAVQKTVSLLADQTIQTTLQVSFATANGAYVEVSAVASTGPRDSSTVFVNAVQTYAVTLQLG